MLKALKQGVVQVLVNPACGRVISTVFSNRVPACGGSINTASPLITATTKAELFWRLYERAEISFARAHLRFDLDIVELGSSIGVMGSVLARRLAPGRKLICVEAHPGLAQVAESNIRRNAPKALISVRQKAINYELAARTSWFRQGDRSDNGTLSSPDREPRLIEVASITLAEILREHAIDGYVLVADIEGAEAGLIACEGESLRKCCQLLIELHDTTFRGKTHSKQQMLDALRWQHGFRLRDSYGGRVYVLER